MKVGLLRLSSLGDVVLATSCLGPLRKALPGSEIVFITRSQYRGVFSNNPHLDRIIAWPSSEPFKRLLARIRAEQFDVLVDLHSTPRSHSITAFSSARKVVRYKKGHIARKLRVLRKKPLKTRHVMDRYLDALEVLGVEKDNPLPAVYPDEEDSSWVEQFLEEHGYCGGPLVAVAPGARKRTKRWSAVRFGRVASKLGSELGVKTVMLGDEADRYLCPEVKKESPGIIDAVGKTDLGKLGALVARSRLILSNDSAPVHFAAAVGTPAIAIFGPTVTEFGFAPSGSGDFVVERELYCRPCSLHGTDVCPEGHFRCMEEIEWDEVFEIAERVVERAC
jgi:heptosyltransferase-2